MENHSNIEEEVRAAQQDPVLIRELLIASDRDRAAAVIVENQVAAEQAEWDAENLVQESRTRRHSPNLLRLSL